MTFLPLQSQYQVGGSLPPTATTYVEREADKILYQSLLAAEFCYVFNARQMGKSSLRVRTMTRLQQVGIQCIAIDLTTLGSQQITCEQWYAAIAAYLQKGFDLPIQLSTWWDEHRHLPIVTRLVELIDKVLLKAVQEPIIIFIDEIDILTSLGFATDDFFSMIRTCCDRRADMPEYRRLTFALFGTTTPNELIDNILHTPFNLGRGIPLQGFSLGEAEQLAVGLQEWVAEPRSVLQRIIYWTSGQPFLTQKLCTLIIDTIKNTQPALRELSDAWIDDLIYRQIIDNWEFQDEPEHLRSIRDHLLQDEVNAGRRLGLCQKLLEEREISIQDHATQTDLLLSGLVTRDGGQLRIKNRIYRQIFNHRWVTHQLASLRPYSVMLYHWVRSGKQDSAWLLRGTALKQAQRWQQGKSLSSLDYEFLQASQSEAQQEIQQRLKTEQLQAENARLLQARQLAALKTILLGVVSTALIGALGLSWFAWQQFQQAKASQVKALASSSQGLFAQHQHLEAMIEALRAKRTLQTLARVDEDIERQVDTALNQAIFGTNELNQLTHHNGGVLSVDVSQDGRLIATASNDRTVKLWAMDGRLLHTLQHQDTVHRVAFSPDAKTLVAGSLDGLVKVWNTDGQLLHEIVAHQQPVWGVAISADGTLMGSASGDRTIKLWSLNTGEPIRTLKTTNSVWNVAFSPDGQQVVGAVVNGTIQRWQITGEPLPPLMGHQAEVWDVAFCAQNGRLVSVSSDRTARIWEPDGTLLLTLQTPEEPALLGVDCSDRGDYIATSGKDNAIHIWQTDGTFVRTVRGHTAVVRDVALGPDGTFAASASDDGSAKLWRRHQYLSRPLEGHEDTVWDIAVSPDSQTIASLGETGELIFWQNFKATFQRPTGQLSLTFDPSGQFVWTTGLSSLIRYPAQSTPAPDSSAVWQRAIPHGTTFGLAVSASANNGKALGDGVIAIGGDDGEISMWRLDGEFLHRFEAHRSRIWQLAFSPDGNVLASASEDGTVKLWQRNGTPIATPVERSGAVWGVDFSPDGQLLVATSLDDTLHLWDLENGTGHHIAGESNGLTRVAFNADGSTIATGGSDATVKLWSREGILQRTLPGHQGQITSLAFSPDGRYLYSGSDDQQVIVWDLEKIAALDPVDYVCDWLHDYLKNAENLSPRDRSLCAD